MQSLKTDKKRKALVDITNIQDKDTLNNEDKLRWEKFDASHWFPLQPVAKLEPIPTLPEQFVMQNVHPHLALYDPYLLTEYISHDDLSKMLNPDDDTELLKLMSDTGVIASKQQCKYCGCNMKFEKQSNNWFWVCNRRVNGKKCNSRHTSSCLRMSNWKIPCISRLIIQITMLIQLLVHILNR